MKTSPGPHSFHLRSASHEVRFVSGSVSCAMLLTLIPAELLVGNALA